MLKQETSSAAALVVGSLALFTDNLVVGLAVPVLPLLPTVVSAGPAWTGVLFASYSVCVVLAALLAGRLVDRYGPKTPLLVGLIGLASATLLFATAGPYWLLLVARCAQGLSAGMSWVASLSLIAATTELDKRGQQMGIAISTITLGVLIGPPLAGFMVGRWGTASPFLLAAGIVTLDGVLRVLLIKGSPRVRDDVAGPAVVLRVPGSLAALVVVVVGAAALAGTEPVLPSHLGASALVVGLLFGLAAATGAVANPVVGGVTTKVSPRVLVGTGVAAASGGLVAVAAAGGSVRQTAVGMFLLGLSSALMQAPATVLISEQGLRAQPPTLGGAFSLYTLTYAGGLAVGPLVAGLAVDKLGFERALTVFATVLSAVGALAAVGLPRKIACQGV